MSTKKAPSAGILTRLRTPPAPAAERTRRRRGKEHVSMTHRLSHASYERLRSICHQHDISLQELYDKALNHWLAANLEPLLEPPPAKNK